MKNRRKNSGITLVALVVTIVVLLILAGITINLLFSDNGIINKAQNAADKTNEAMQNDSEGLQNLEDQMNGIVSEGSNSNTPVVDITTLTEIQTENKKAKDSKGNIVTVPKGFKVATSEGTTVQKGIVIEDKDGNQFVWIPVGEVTKDDGSKTTIQLGRYTFDGSNGTPTLVQAAYTEANPTNYTQEVVINSYYKELTTYRAGVASSETDGLNATAKNLAEFVNSTKTNGGYYLARYEASYGSGSTTSDYKPLSKVSTGNGDSIMRYTKGTLWNNITQLNASKVSQNMYTTIDNVGVESDLTNSYAWDTAIVYIQEMGNSNYANKKGTEISTRLKNTGETGDKVCNIYDIAANLLEWTTEYSTYPNSYLAGSCTNRSGSYSSGRNDFATNRNNFNATNIFGIISFRVTLYIK